MLEVKLLGRFEITHGEKAVELSSRTAQSLFAFLILNAGTGFRREKLAGQLWPDSTEESARDYLRHALWRIRKALQLVTSTSFLKADDLTVAFEASSSYLLDAKALADANEHGSTAALMAALDAYTGELLPGFYDEWVIQERQQLQALFERKTAALLELLQHEQRWSEVLQWGEKWIGLSPNSEAAYRFLMISHAALGDRGNAAAVFERCKKALGELGMEPSGQTQKLFDEVRAGGFRERPATLPMPAVPHGPPRSSIPVPLTSFVGREAEIAAVARLFERKRLVTLTGPGGVGKTRLAIEAARVLAKRLKDGAHWVELSGLADPDLIPQEIAQALHVHEVPSEPLLLTLSNHLRGKDLLLVLDNCEHLIRSVAEFSEQLLSACPKLKVLTTSVEALGIFNETTWQVPSLPLPEARRSSSITDLERCASVQLFVERAANARPGFALTELNARSVARICQRLDGIPLAIELASARIRALSVDEILTRLDDRFSLLTSGSRTAIPRHQTLRATIDWSHDLLTDSEKILFRRLAVFAGGFTLDAAERVCVGPDAKAGGIFDLLARLLDKSLVMLEPAGDGPETRYRLLETIRQYALEKLIGAADAPEIRERHASFYLELAEQSEQNIFGRQSVTWFRRLEEELENIRSAIEWSTASGNPVLALRILGSLVYFWSARGQLGFEWNDRVRESLRRPECQEPTLARAKALNGIAFMYWADIHPTQTRAEVEEALAIGRQYQDHKTIATAFRNIGISEIIGGNSRQGREPLERSLEEWRQMGDEGSMEYARTLVFLGEAHAEDGQPMKARVVYEEAAALLRPPGDVNFLAMAVRRLGQLAWHEERLAEATALCKESLQLNQQVGDLRGILASLAGFAAIATFNDGLDKAAVLAAAVQTQLADASIRLLYMDRVELDHNVQRLREEMAPRAMARWWGKGTRLSLDAAIALALEQA